MMIIAEIYKTIIVFIYTRVNLITNLGKTNNKIQLYNNK